MGSSKKEFLAQKYYLKMIYEYNVKLWKDNNNKNIYVHSI